MKQKTHTFDDGETVSYHADKKNKNGNELDGRQHLDHPFPVEITEEDKKEMRKLTPQRRERWEECIAIVREGVGKFVEVGLAVLEIKNDKLWEEDYLTWEAFCEDVLGESKTHVNRRIRAARVVEAIKKAEPIGSTDGETDNWEVLPSNESQARALASYASADEPGKLCKAWADVLKYADGNPPTAAVINEALGDQPEDGGENNPNSPGDGGATEKPIKEQLDEVLDELRQAHDQQDWKKVETAIEILAGLI